MMKCPNCGSEKSEVTQTRAFQPLRMAIPGQGYVVKTATKRYRRCLGCRVPFQTYELMEDDATLEDYNLTVQKTMELLNLSKYELRRRRKEGIQEPAFKYRGNRPYYSRSSVNKLISPTEGNGK